MMPVIRILLSLSKHILANEKQDLTAFSILRYTYLFWKSNRERGERKKKARQKNKEPSLNSGTHPECLQQQFNWMSWSQELLSWHPGSWSIFHHIPRYTSRKLGWKQNSQRQELLPSSNYCSKCPCITIVVLTSWIYWTNWIWHRKIIHVSAPNFIKHRWTY